ncbi:hypothetical protein H7F15_17285 [Pontibacter sp. Tf4]|uniref:hypothetical protein n=1 Tax=Pontibacter sp. Tf4 TaxID=2761620 RepID=UPI0016298E31|nr:hypothetical protein [Pontibacter sp. Tf4]MBB6612799.1 hypothetical protein [Pontibacter sp. Tf4]
MKLYLISTLLAAVIIIASSCNTDNRKGIDIKSEISNDNANQALKTCISEIKIIYPDPQTEAPDIVEFYINSTDSSLNHILKTKSIENLLFIEGDQSGGEESRFGSGIKITELKKDYFKLHYITSHFRGYPVDTVEEEGSDFLVPIANPATIPVDTVEEEGSDFIQTAQLVITDKNGKQWNIKSCSQLP